MHPSVDPGRAAALLARFRGRRLLVVGDIMLDRYVFGEVTRISPEAPVPIVRALREEERLGGGANVARNLVALGAEAVVCGVIGDDADGGRVRALLAEAGVRGDLLVVAPGRPTTRKVRIIAHQQQVVRVDHERDDPLDAPVEEAIGKKIEEAMETSEAVVLSDYAKGVVAKGTITRAVRAAGSERKVFVDPKVKHFSLYRGVHLVTPNLGEASLAAGERIVDEASLARAGKSLLALLPGTTVLVTRGAEGMSLFEPDGRTTHIRTAAREVFDVTGAGDTVIATYALAAVAGGSAVEAAVFANHAAGEAVQEAGAAAIPIEALRRALGAA